MSTHTQSSPWLVRAWTASGRVDHLRLIKCPACGEPLGDPRAPGQSPVPDHIESHSPEDFGLTPMGVRP